MSFAVFEELNNYKQDGNGPYAPPPFAGTKLGPTSAVNDGSPPFPSTEKQNNRRTNVSIPYTRAVGTAEDGAGELRHGELVFTNLRKQSGSPLGNGTGAFVTVFGLAEVNAQIGEPFALPTDVDKNSPPFRPKYLMHPHITLRSPVNENDIGHWLPEEASRWAPDGVVNVVDQLSGGDTTNVTVQGPASMINCAERGQVCCARSELPLSRLHVGMRATRHISILTNATTYTLQMELFSSLDVRRGTVKMDDWGESNSKLVRVWQYGRVVDSRHVEDRDERRIMANIFVQPPMVPRPGQKKDRLRLGSMFRASHLSPPNGRLWAPTGVESAISAQDVQDRMPEGFEMYIAKDKTSRADITPEMMVAFNSDHNVNVGTVSGYIRFEESVWNDLHINHDNNGNTTLFYNMYVIVEAIRSSSTTEAASRVFAAYVPVVSKDYIDYEPSEREGAFDLPDMHRRVAWRRRSVEEQLRNQEIPHAEAWQANSTKALDSSEWTHSKDAHQKVILMQ